MKRQTRPFAIELKTSRKSTLPLRGASTPGADWIDPFTGDVPERDVYEDLVIDEQSDARRQAEQLFARPREPGKRRATDVDEAVVAKSPQAESRAPRILPDLLAHACDNERQAQDQLDLEQARHRPPLKRARKSRLPATEELPLESPPVPQVSPLALAHVTVLPSPASGEPTATHVERGPNQLPLGQRWKERRLPRICWEQPGVRRRQRRW